jgi:hypothetical protein
VSGKDGSKEGIGKQPWPMEGKMLESWAKAGERGAVMQRGGD